MRFKAILADAARKRYPLSIMLIVLGILVIPFPYLFIHFGLEQTEAWWTVLGICVGVVVGCGLIGLGSLVEDIHDISMHTVGFDLEFTESEGEDFELDDDADYRQIDEEASPEQEEPPTDE